MQQNIQLQLSKGKILYYLTIIARQYVVLTHTHKRKTLTTGSLFTANFPSSISKSSGSSSKFNNGWINLSCAFNLFVTSRYRLSASHRTLSKVELFSISIQAVLYDNIHNALHVHWNPLHWSENLLSFWWKVPKILWCSFIESADELDSL